MGFKLRTFSRVRFFLNTKAALTVYKSTILPIVDYDDYFQFLWNVEKARKLQTIQNWGLCITYTGETFSELEMHNTA